MYNKCYLVINNREDAKQVDEMVEYIRESHAKELVIVTYKDKIDVIKEDEVCLLYLSDDEIKRFLINHIGTNINIAIIPNASCTKAMKSYGISSDIYEGIDDGFNDNLLNTIDLLACNETIVFVSAIIGDMHGMNHYDFSEASLWNKIAIFWKNLSRLRFKDYLLKISQDKEIQTVATGISVLEQSFTNSKSKINEVLPTHDGKLNTFILAPTSLIAYLWYLFSIFITKKISLASLPKGVGYIQSSQLNITSSEPIEFMIDGSFACAKEMEFLVYKDSLKLHFGRALEPFLKKETQKDVKTIQADDTVNITTLPQKALGEILIGGRLPFFKRATDDEFKDLFIGLRSSAKFSSIFLTLMILSTLLATTGLFANSTSVVIGAMILAPLMQPIVSLAMGTIRTDISLISQSIKTLFIGVFMAILFSSLFTILMPLKEITPEMMSRLHPNVLDLMVAIFSGIAGAYATAKEEIAKSLAGVAIAVALVPPLSVTGIGLGMLNPEVIYGSFLLFATNLIGIVLSASFTFVVLGYSPVHRATKAIVYTFLMMLFVSIPLVLSFVELVEKNNYLNQLKSIKHVVINKHDLEFNVIELKETKGKLALELNVISDEVVPKNDLRELKKEIETKINKDIDLKVNLEIKVK